MAERTGISWTKGPVRVVGTAGQESRYPGETWRRWGVTRSEVQRLWIVTFLPIGYAAGGFPTKKLAREFVAAVDPAMPNVRGAESRVLKRFSPKGLTLRAQFKGRRSAHVQGDRAIGETTA